MINEPIKRSVRIMIKNWKRFAMIAVFDLVFVLLLFNLKILLVDFNKWLYNIAYQAGWPIKIVFVFIFLLMLLFFILVYTFFKYLVLDRIQGIFRRIKFRFDRFVLFLKVNLIAFLPITILLVLFIFSVFFYFNRLISGGIGSSLDLLFPLFATTMIGLILFIYSYTLLNLSHSIFLKERGLKRIIKKAFIRSFWLDSYRLYWQNFKIILAFGIFLLVIHIFMKLFVLTDMMAYLRYNGYYKLFLKSSSILVVYFLLLFNRLNFYLLCSNNARSVK